MAFAGVGCQEESSCILRDERCVFVGKPTSETMRRTRASDAEETRQEALSPTRIRWRIRVAVHSREAVAELTLDTADYIALAANKSR